MTQHNQKSEGPLAKAIEEQTAKLPSDIFLWAALGAMGVSLTLKLLQKNTLHYLSGNGLRPFYCSAFIISWLNLKVMISHPNK